MSLVYDPESGRYIDVPLGGFGVTPYTAPAPQATSPRVQAAPNFRRPGMLGGLFANLGNRIGPGKSLIHGNFDLGNLRELPGNIRATQIWENGPTVAQGANALSGIYQGGKAVKGLFDNMNSDNDLRNLKDDLSLEMASNPMYDMYMDAGDEKTLRQMKNGTLTNGFGDAMSGVMQGIPQAALSAVLGGIAGGAPGAAINGIGSLVNSGISGYGKGSQEASNKLQGLYDKLKRANDDYRIMKRPSGLRQAGLSTQYFNQLY
jgi:hypothetical protein